MNEPIKACVIGDPVAHSLSPRLHNFWLNRYNINGSYTAQHVTQEGLEGFLRTLAQQGYVGCNITLPHKEKAMSWMDNISEEAKQVAAINTVIVQKDGSLLGTNTDIYGFKTSIRDSVAAIAPAKRMALIVGAGGAARAVIVALKSLGFSILLCNRTRQNAEILAQRFGEITIINWQEKDQHLADIMLLVNTTSLGLAGHDPLELSLALLPKEAVVCDIVYRPLHTALLQQAQKLGNPIVTGIPMLLYQAAAGFEAWFGVKPEVNEALQTHVLKEDK